jgi:hypothetical protein
MRRKKKYIDPKVLRRRAFESLVIDYVEWLIRTYKYDGLEEESYNNRLVLKVLGFMPMKNEKSLPLNIERDMNMHSPFRSGKGIYLYIYSGYWSVNLTKYKGGIKEIVPYAV